MNGTQNAAEPTTPEVRRGIYKCRACSKKGAPVILSREVTLRIATTTHERIIGTTKVTDDRRHYEFLRPDGSWNIYMPDAKCPSCNRTIYGDLVKGTYSEKHKCGKKCTQATGTNCECQCAGRNHGSDWQELAEMLREIEALAITTTEEVK